MLTGQHLPRREPKPGRSCLGNPGIVGVGANWLRTTAIFAKGKTSWERPEHS